MLSQKSVKILIGAAILIAGFSACGWWKTADEAPRAASPAVREAPRDLPFGNAEPEVYQAEIVVSLFAHDEKSVKKTFVAKNAAQCLITFDAGEKTAFSVLKTGAGSFLFSDARRVYAVEDANRASVAEDPLGDFLSAEWLNAKTPAAFENLGTVDSITTFRVHLDGARNTEVLIFVDENLKLPIKQEFYSAVGEQKKLALAMEITNFKPATDDQYFAIPAGYRRVSPHEFAKIVFQDE